MIPTNWMSVLIASVAAFALGFLWYGPVFGSMWMKALGRTKADIEKEKNKMGMMFAITFAGAVIEAFVLTKFIHYAGAYTLMDGAKTGLWAAIGFVGPTMLANYLYQGKSKQLFLIDFGYQSAVLLVMGAVLAYWF